MFASTTAGTCRFRSEFFTCYQQKSESQADDSAVAPPSGPGISYSASLHGSHKAFCDGPLFPPFLKEMRALLDGLIRFAVQEGMPQKEKKKVIDGLNRLFDRRFKEPYLQRYAELIDGAGKRSLESICAMVRNETIALETRRAVILSLSAGVGVCSEGTVSNLIAAERSLLMSVGGIKARLWKMKEECTRSVLQEAVYEKFRHRPTYVGNEIHFVNAVWNYLADAIGLEQIRDSFAPKLQDLDFLNECWAKVYAAITPDKFASILAEQCLGIFTSHVVSDTTQAAGECSEEIMNLFDVALDSVLLDLRLGQDRLTLHAFVNFDDTYQRYTLRGDPTLVALALLDAIHAERLMDDMPIHRGEWRDMSGQRAALFDYGALAWRSRLLDNVPIKLAWNDMNASSEPLTIPDLHAWIKAQGQDVIGPPIVALRTTIRSSDPKELIDIPGNWLVDAETTIALLARLGNDAAGRYLSLNLSYFRNGFPRGHRIALIDGATGMENAVLRLARYWYPDPWALLHEARGKDGATRLQRWMVGGNECAIDTVRLLAEDAWCVEAGSKGKGDLAPWRTLRGSSHNPMFHDAMAAGNMSAIGAWRRLLCSPAVLPEIGRLLPDILLANTNDGTSALYAAMQHNRAKAVEAFHDFLIDPVILPRIKAKLPKIVAGTGVHSAVNERTIALTVAMDLNCGPAIRAYGKLLIDPAIFPIIRSKLPKLFGCGRVAGGSLLWWAMNKGCADAVKAYHEILTYPCILECIKGHLPALIADKSWRVPVPALHIALSKGKWAAIQAYHALVADPRVTPSIARMLPHLLFALDGWGNTGLAVALGNGHARAVSAFHMLIADPGIVDHIRHYLGALLKARARGQLSGLARAVALGHTEVVKAFHALLVDLQILPNILDALPDLLVARRVSGMRGLKEAITEGHLETVDAYRAMLADPLIAPHILDAIRQRMPASKRSGIAPALASTQNLESMPDTGSAVAAQAESALSHGRNASRSISSPSPESSAWKEEIDQWVTYYTTDRSTRPGLVERVRRYLQP